MKVALVYDRVNKIGGAERVLKVLHEIFPKAPLFTAVYNKKTARWADVFAVKTTFLHHIPKASTNHEYFAWLAPLAFEELNLDEYDLVISITSEYAKGIITKPGTLHICYCLTPTRYLWSGYQTYFTSGWFRLLSKPFVNYLRSWDKVAAQRPDYYIAISQTVRERIKKYYGRESVVVYPPITLEDDRRWKVEGRNLKMEGGSLINHLSSNFKNLPSTFYHPPSKKQYFLLVSRLVPYKRIDIAVEAFNQLGWPLKIVGTGREFEKLKAAAASNIEFLQNLTDEALSSYYQDCIALIFPGEEDFGLAILEAQSFGKPIIAYGSGGALETVVEGKTGEFFAPQTKEALVEKLKSFDATRYNVKDCQRQAEKFSKERFKIDLINLIDLISKKHQIL